MKNGLDLNQKSDEELALTAKTGSRPAFEELVRRYSGRLFIFLLPKINSEAETEDIVQETFLKLYRNIVHFDPRFKFSTWLYTAASRLAISHFRKKKITRDIPVNPGQGTDPLLNLEKKEVEKNLWRTASLLNDKQYQVLWLYYKEELSIKDIALALKKTPMAVRTLLHRSRLNLLQKITAEPGQNKNQKAVKAALWTETRRF
jgi:RNA polymerase sigma-70 factor (ECF subfamily)